MRHNSWDFFYCRTNCFSFPLCFTFASMLASFSKLLEIHYFALSFTLMVNILIRWLQSVNSFIVVQKNKISCTVSYSSWRSHSSFNKLINKIVDSSQTTVDVVSVVGEVKSVQNVKTKNYVSFTFERVGITKLER